MADCQGLPSCKGEDGMKQGRILRSTFHLAAIIALLAAAGHTATAETLEELPTRPGVTVPVLFDAPAAPKAVVLLFPGGNGKVRLWRDNPPTSRNFLVRSRMYFSTAGLAAVVVDVPSDRRRPGLSDFRSGDRHREDVKAVIAWARARWQAPLWLVGTSRGTVTTAYLGALPGVDGLVFSSSVTLSSNNNPATALDGKLDAIKAPVLLVHHKEDECRVTPPEGVGWIRDRLKSARVVETLWFDGGDPPQSNPCRAMSAHGYLGIEKKVVDAIAARIIALTPR
jgi:hypothetical protein